MGLRLFFQRSVPLALLLLRRRRITPRKLWTLARNMYAGYVRKLYRRGPSPSVMMMEMTNACNLACSGCALQMDESVSMQTPRKMIDLKIYRRIIDDVKDDLILLVPYLGGESFLNKRIFEALQYASERGISISVATTGSYDHIDDFGRKVSEAGIDFLFFSISGLTQEIYEKFHRKGDLAKVIANIKDVTRFPASKRPRVSIRYLLTAENAHQVRDLAAFTKEVGADFYELRQVDGELQLVDEISSAAEGKTTLTANDTCPWLWASTVVKAHGEVIPCCYDYYGVPEMGAVSALSSIRDIWNGPTYRKFRETWHKEGNTLDCCSQCRPSIGYQDAASVNRDQQFVRTTRMKV